MPAPRKQQARNYDYSDDDGDDNFGRQASVFRERGSRTMVVKGTAESAEKPDVIHLSFLVVETADTLLGGIAQVGRTLAQIRAVATELGGTNENVFSDSISSETIKERIGYYEAKSNNNKPNVDDVYDSNDDDDDDDQVFRTIETKVSHKVKSVVRIYLQGGDDMEKTFSSLCYQLMTKLGLRTHRAPIYELSNLNELRNEARKDAMQNAKQKAAAILDALDDNTVALGPPIAVTDIHCNLRDDAQSSFLGNWGSVSTTKTVVRKEDIQKTSTTATEEPSPKRARTEETMAESSTELDPKTIFVVPTIRVVGSVRCMFEIAINDSSQPETGKESN